MQVFRRVQTLPRLMVPRSSTASFCSSAAKLDRMKEEFSGCAQSFFEKYDRNAQQTALRDSFVRNAAVQKGQEEILDVACGPGITTVAMAKEDPLRIIGVDIAEGMLQTAEQHAREHGVDSRVSFQLCNVAELPFPNESFSLVTQRLGFHHFHEYQRVFAEMARVCRKGGRIVIMDVTVESDNGGDPSEEAVEWNTIVESIRDPTHHRFLLTSEVKAMADANGLVDFRVSDEHLNVVFEGEEWVRMTGHWDQRWATVKLMKSLCKLGVDSGMSLRMENDQVYFTHRYRVWSAVKA